MRRQTDDLAGVLGDAHLLILFDGWCGICTRAAAWACARAAGRIAALPAQTPGLRARLGLTRVQTDREVWCVDRAGQRSAGPACVNAVLGELGGGWPVVARLLALPGLFWLERLAYRAFARHRGRFARWGQCPPCEKPGAGCIDGP